MRYDEMLIVSSHQPWTGILFIFVAKEKYITKVITHQNKVRSGQTNRCYINQEPGVLRWKLVKKPLTPDPTPATLDPALYIGV